MKKNRSIKHRLAFSIISLTTSVFIFVIIAIFFLERNRSSSAADILRSGLEKQLIAKGITISDKINNSISRTIPIDSQASTLKKYLSETIRMNTEVSYIIIMKPDRLCLYHLSKDSPDGVSDCNSFLNDSLSFWASRQSGNSYKEVHDLTIPVVEFASPVSANHSAAIIRVGISRQSINLAVEKTIQNGTDNFINDLFVILPLFLLSVIISFLLANHLAKGIRAPIESLINSTSLVADGHYDISISHELDDEIGILALNFDNMLISIRNNTEHLQKTINEKLLQVTDILNNIDQGLFTINLDCSVNREYSRHANDILKVNDIAKSTIQEIFRMDERQHVSFVKWIDLVKRSHNQIRWHKLEKLAPIHEIELPDENNVAGSSFVSFSYQCIFDTNNVLSKIMILALDITETRMKDLRMATERQHYENDLKALLCIVNSTPEEIIDFMDDTSSRLDELTTQVTVHLDGVTRQRDSFPFGQDYHISQDAIDSLYRDLHTIKGNSGSYGFDLLTAIAHQAENQLEKLRQSVMVRRSEDLRILQNYLFRMKSALEEIRQKIKLIFGDDDQFTCRIPEYHIESILSKCNLIQDKSIDEQISDLINECRMLTWKPLRILFRKYDKSARTMARKLHKNVTIIIKNEKVFFNPVIFSKLDEIIVHLIRNAIDHGIENQETREELGKGTGKIYIELAVISDECVLNISDDGKGIDVEILLSNAIKKNYITAEDAVCMNNEDKIGLIFKSGLTTSTEITELSGRGMGLDIVMHKVNSLGGRIKTTSVFGQGTSFRIRIPVVNLLKQSPSVS